MATRNVRSMILAVTLALAGIAGPVSVLTGGSATASPAGSNPNQAVDTSASASALAQQLVGAGVSVSNVSYTGDAQAKGTFTFNDPTTVGMNGGIVLSSGNAAESVGPNSTDWYSTDWGRPGDPQLDQLSGFTTYDAASLSFDFVPTTNQVAFQYAFASDEYPEWVNTGFNDVFAFIVTDHSGASENCAQVRQVAGDPSSPFVPVAVNNINDSNPVQNPAPTSMRPDLFRPNYQGSATLDLESDGITKVLTCQAAVTPGQVNHMKLAISDASDGIYDSNVFIKASSLVSDANPVADLGLDPSNATAPATINASVEGSDPNGAALSYSINWGDGSSTATTSLPHETDLVSHVYQYAGTYAATLTVSNGTHSGTSCDEVKLGGIVNPAGAVSQSCDVSGTGVGVSNPGSGGGSGGGGGGNQPGSPGVDSHPTSLSVSSGASFTFTAMANASVAPSAQWQVSADGGDTFEDLPGKTGAVKTTLKNGDVEYVATLTGTAWPTMDGLQYRAVYTNDQGSDATDSATLSVGGATATLSTSADYAGIGGKVTFTVGTTTMASGTAILTDGPSTLGSISVKAGTGSKAFAWTKTGFHNVTATFTAKGAKSSVKTLPAQVQVGKTTTTTKLVVKAKVVRGKTSPIAVTVSVPKGVPASLVAGGTLTISDGGMVLASGISVPSSGKVTWTWNSTGAALGAHSFAVEYSGNASAEGSWSNAAVSTVSLK